MQNKTVLIFIDWFFPGFKSGGPATSVYSIVQLLKSDFNFKIITRNYDYLNNKNEYTNIKKNEWNTVENNFSVFYMSDDYCSLKNIKQLIKNTQSDYYYINSIFSFWYAILPLILLKKNEKVLVSSRGMLSDEALELKALKKNSYLILANLFRLFKNINFHVTSYQESIDVRQSIKAYKKITTIVNLNLCPFVSKLITIEKKQGEISLLYLGRIAKEKNLITLLTALKNCKYTVKLTIAGQIYDRAYYNNCEILINNMPKNISIKYVGSIDKNEIENEIINNHALVMPSLSENFGHAALEALSFARPIIASNTTPWTNLKEQKIGFNFDAKNETELLNTINEIALFTNEELTKWCNNSFNYAKKHFTIEDTIEQYKKLFS